MSLIKLAIIANPFVTGLSSLPILFSLRAAKSGDPFKYVFTRTKGPIRSRIQKATLAGFANMEANMRKGMVQDSTSWKGAALDAQLGQFGRMGGKALEGIHLNPTPMNLIGKAILGHTITDDGKFIIPNVEKLLEAGNRNYELLDKVKNLPLARTGLVAGSALGYATGDNEHKLKSTIKGGLIGGSLGGSLRSMVDYAHQKGSFIPHWHKEYFKDNYWKSQLEAANDPLYHNIGKHILADQLTAFPADRARRIAASEKWLARGDKFWEKANSGVLGKNVSDLRLNDFNPFKKD